MHARRGAGPLLRDHRGQGDRQENHRELSKGMQGPRGDSGLRRRLDKPRRGGMFARVGRIPRHIARPLLSAQDHLRRRGQTCARRRAVRLQPVLGGPVRRAPSAQAEAPDLPFRPQSRASARRIRIGAFRRGHRPRPRMRPQARRDLRDTRRRPRCGAHDRHRPRNLAGEHRRAELLRRISRALRDAAAGMARRRAALLGRLGRIQAAAREERPPPRRGAPQKRYERAVAHRGRRMHALRAQARP